MLIVAILFVGLILHEQGIIKQADESSAAGMLRTMNTAAITYQSSYHNGFPPSQAAFGGETPGTCDAPGLFADSSFEMLGVNGGVQRSGYTITYTGGAALTSAAPGCTAPGVTAYVIHADPVSRGKTGQRSFFTDETGVIRSNQDGVATKDSAPIE
ncbi:MAG TPA: hypothetical protein VLV88_16240 [Terriglobales bacterium]|nr:hypothetical protein [Terriglobales bacterium]